MHRNNSTLLHHSSNMHRNSNNMYRRNRYSSNRFNHEYSNR